MQKDARHIELISKYLAGEATREEISLLENWVMESTENKTLFNNYKQAWLLTNSPNQKAINVDQEWRKINQLLFASEAKIVPLPKENKRSSFFFIKIAAAILFLVAATIWLIKSPGESKLQVVYADNKIEEITLPDGSNVSANRASTITYPKHFEKDTRTIALEGAAFFEIKHQPEQPFIVKTQELIVKVLGTSFYINSQKTAPTISVIVRTGRVSMKRGNNEIILTKGEKGIYHKSTKQLEKVPNDDANYLAWKTKIFNFDHTLAYVVDKLNEAYHSNIIITDDALRDCPITASFTNQSLRAILNVLRETTELEIKETKEGILISGEGLCK